jgi:hypothetical protein
MNEQAENSNDQLVMPTLGESSNEARTVSFADATQSATTQQAANFDRRRDRIVVLGRRQAGKTLFISMLYWILWRSRGKLAMKAVQGQTHAACMENLQFLQKGRWPAATAGSRFLDFEVSYRGVSRSLVMLDYPGEVFRRAFITNEMGPDVEELLEHVDRAAALILLTDPSTVLSSDLMERADDDFGLLKAVERVRTSVGGERVPVALVLTKIDLRHASIEKRGGAEQFIKKYYAQLVRELKEFKWFTASACGNAIVDGQSRPLLDAEHQPVGIVEPLEYVVQYLDRLDQDRQADDLKAIAEKVEAEEAQRGRRKTFGIAAAVFVVGGAVMSLVVWLVVKYA